MNKKTLIYALIIVLVLVVPGGFFLAAIVAKTKLSGNSDTPATSKTYTVGNEGNPTDAEDEANMQFNTYALIDYLGMTETTFFALNPELKNTDFVPFGLIVNIA